MAEWIFMQNVITAKRIKNMDGVQSVIILSHRVVQKNQEGSIVFNV